MPSKTPPTQPIHRIAEELVDANSIFAVCLVFLLLIVPHYPHLPGWIIGFIVTALSWRVLQNMGKVKAVPRWLLVVLVLAGGISVFAQYWTIVGRDAGLAMLSVMTAFKFLESRSHRDLLILIFLCYFLLATHFLFSQSILIAVFTFCNLIFITSTLITLNQRDASVSLRQRLSSSTRLVLYSLPLMLVLFVLVPRIPGPLWSLENQQRGGVTGLSDQMSPGNISNLIRSNEVAFRVNFDGPVPAQSKLYWRGPVMVGFDGRSWYQQPRESISQFRINAKSPVTKYTITLEPNGQKWLFGLDIPLKRINNSQMSADYQLINEDPINDLKRYQLQSMLSYQLGQNESLDYLLEANDFPANRNPKTIALGRQWERQFSNKADIVQQALKMYRQQEFVYTLQPPLLGKNPADEFLFDSRRGFCEHYASSFSLLMRAAGIPSRVITGYQGGEFNDIGRYLIVRQSDAHAWTEVWLEDEGWVRVDPTAAVSPDRIEKGLDAALPNEKSAFQFQQRNALLGSILFSWDNLQHNWNDWVINYNQTKQQRFLRDLDIGIENWSDMVFALVFLLTSITASFWLISWIRILPARPEEFERLMKKLLKKLSRLDLKKQPAEDMRAFLNRIVDEEQNILDAKTNTRLKPIFELYSRIKYGPKNKTALRVSQFKRLISTLPLS